MKATKGDLNRIIDTISFRFLQPDEIPSDELLQKNDASNNVWLSHMNQLSYLNTSFAECDAEVHNYFKPLARIPAMSTLAMGYIISEIASLLDDDEVYLNVGVWNGFSFFAGALNKQKKSIGVDNFSQFGCARIRFYTAWCSIEHSKSKFYEMDYIEYFQSIHEECNIGFYFYDGDHSYQNQLTALTICHPFLSSNAIILVDDTNLPAVRSATLDFLKHCHGWYELVYDQFTAGNPHPTFHNGFMLLRKCS